MKTLPFQREWAVSGEIFFLTAYDVVPAGRFRSYESFNFGSILFHDASIWFELQKHCCKILPAVTVAGEPRTPFLETEKKLRVLRESKKSLKGIKS